MMNLHIVGAGSIGLLIAGKLGAAGVKVNIYTRTEEQAVQLRNCGIELEEMDGSVTVAIPHAVHSLERHEGIGNRGDAWIIVTVKQKHFDDVLLRQLRDLARDEARILCLQNGVGHVEKLEHYIARERILVGITTEGAKRVSPVSVKHTGSGETWIGPACKTDGQDAFYEKCLIDFLSAAGFNVFMSKKIDRMIYRKLLINAIINPLTAMLRITNGQLLDSPERMQLMQWLFAEAIAVYDAKGIDAGEDLWEQLLQVCQDTSANTSSMLKDVQQGAETEIEWINGSLIRIADSVNLQVPTHRMLYTLVKAISQ